MHRVMARCAIGSLAVVAGCGPSGPELSEPAQGCFGVAQQLIRSPDSIKIVDVIGVDTPIILDLRADNAFGTQVAVKVICEMDKAPATKRVLKMMVDGVEIDPARLYAAQAMATVAAMKKIDEEHR